MPSSPDGKISCNSRSPNVKKKKYSRAKHQFNQSQEAKLLQSERQKCYHCLILNLSRCVGKRLIGCTYVCVYIYIHTYTHPISDTHLTEHEITPTCKAALLHCVPVSSAERTGFRKMPKDPSTVAGTKQQTKPEVLHPSFWADGPSTCIQTYMVQKSKILLSSFLDLQRGRETGLKSVTPKVYRRQCSKVPPIMPTSPALRAAIGQEHQLLDHRRDATPMAGSRTRNAILGHSCKFSWCVTKPCCSAEQLEQFGNFYLRRNLCSCGTALGHRRANVKALKTLAWVLFYARIVCCYFYTTCLAKDT